MTTNAEAARDNPSTSKVELFDSLMTISSLTKALAKQVLLLPTGNKAEGGKRDDKEALNFSSEQ